MRNLHADIHLDHRDRHLARQRYVNAAAAAIANARAARRGAPPISNVLELLGSSPNLKVLLDEVLEDAGAAVDAIVQVLLDEVQVDAGAAIAAIVQEGGKV